MKLADITYFYTAVLSRAVDEVAKNHLLNVDVDAVALVRDLIRSDEFFEKWLLDNHSTRSTRRVWPLSKSLFRREGKYWIWAG